jgi:hypothetical protein
MSTRILRWVGLFTGVAALVSGSSFAAVAYADTLQSPNYQFEESVLGAGGLVQSNSANYQAGSTVGEAATGDSASPNFQVQAGNKTSPDPVLKFSVDNSNANFGNFSTSTAATATATFSVSNYTSYGYAVQIIGAPPANGAHTIDALASTDSSISGMEQFGINLVANTDPASVGANPDQGQFGFGVASPNYATSNQYRYVSGETIATAPKSSGVTKYTISYVVNVNSLTPGGQYTSNQTLICTGTF